MLGSQAEQPFKNSKWQTVVSNAGSSGKFLAVVDLDVSNGKVADFRYKLLPVFSNLLEPDAEMAALIAKHRKPYLAEIEEKLAFTEGLLFRRGNFNSSWDQLILDALRDVKGAEIAFSPGFRWGGTILPNQPITMEQLKDQTAITYPCATIADCQISFPPPPLSNQTQFSPVQGEGLCGSDCRAGHHTV